MDFVIFFRMLLGVKMLHKLDDLLKVILGFVDIWSLNKESLHRMCQCHERIFLTMDWPALYIVIKLY